MRYSNCLLTLPFLLPFINASPDTGADAAGSTSANTTRPTSSCTGDSCSTSGSQWRAPTPGGAGLDHSYTYPNGSVAFYQVKTADLIANINSAIAEAIAGHPGSQSVPVPYSYNNVTITGLSGGDSLPNGLSISYSDLVTALQFIGAKLPTDDEIDPVTGVVAADLDAKSIPFAGATYNVNGPPDNIAPAVDPPRNKNPGAANSQGAVPPAVTSSTTP